MFFYRNVVFISEARHCFHRGSRKRFVKHLQKPLGPYGNVTEKTASSSSRNETLDFRQNCQNKSADLAHTSKLCSVIAVKYKYKLDITCYSVKGNTDYNRHRRWTLQWLSLFAATSVDALTLKATSARFLRTDRDVRTVSAASALTASYRQRFLMSF